MKLIRFTDPFPGEHMFNIFGRYKKMRRYISRHPVTQDLRDSRASIGNTNMPNRLGRLIEVLPPNHHYSVNYFIENHTLFPFFSAFLSSSREQSLRKYMGEVYSGPQVGNAKFVEFFRYCPECVQADRDRYGQAFLHRDHQVFFMDLCCNHKCPLWQTTIKTLNAENYFTLEEILEMGRGRPLPISDFIDNDLLKQFVSDTCWLLGRQPASTLIDILREKYITLLINNDLMPDTRLNSTGLIRHSEFLEKFRRFYSKDTIAYFGAELNDVGLNWLYKIIRTDFSQAPIFHLMLSHFLGYSIKELVADNIELYTLPLDNQVSWPCLNHLCKHFHKFFIKTIINYDTGRGKKRKQFIKVSCSECGYTYNKVVLFGEKDDPFRIGMVDSYGWLWDTTLREFWEKPDVSLTDIRKHLKISYITLIKQAIRLNLTPFRSFGTIFGMTKPEPMSEDEILKISMDSSHDITDDQWGILKPLINESSPRLKGKVEHYRDWINAIVWKYHSGFTWPYIPKRYGSKDSISTRCKKWRKSGVLDEIFAILGLDISHWDMLT